MLEFQPQSINSVSIFPDDADSQLYYYLPETPQLGKFQLIKYRGENRRGGVFNLEVNLRLPEENLSELREDLGEDIKLTPVNAIAGSASLLFFNREFHPRQPALFADQQVTFTVELDTTETVLLEQAFLTGNLTPLAVVYRLDYLALRPAYRFRLQANWEQVQQRIEERFSANAIIFQVDVENIVEELVTDRLIFIELDSFTTEGIEDRDRFLQEVQTMVLNTFFTPRLKPIEVPETNNFSFLPSFSYRRIEINQIDRRFLNLQVNEQTTVRRSIYPQGTLIVPDINPQEFIITLDTDDPFFRTRRVEVISRADFKTDGIAAITVTLQYSDNRIQTLLFTDSNDRQQVSWNLESTREVRVKYRVQFQTEEAEIESPEIVTSSDFFEVVPRQLYQFFSIPILALNSTPWEKYDAIQVKTRYRDKEQLFYLNQQQREQTWNLLIRDSLSPRFQYQLNYQATVGEDVLTPWFESENEILIHNPFPLQRTLQLIPQIDWLQVQEVEVEVIYLQQQQRFRFTEDNAKPKLFSANILNPNHRLVHYNVTFFDKLGNLQQVPESMTLDNRLFLRSPMRGHRVIEIAATAINFDGELEAITVETRFEKPSNVLFAVANFQLTTSADHAYFQFNFDRDQTYEYRTTYHYQNGMQGRSEWQTTDEDLLLPEMRTLRSFLIKNITISMKNINRERFKSIVVQLQQNNQEKEIELRPDHNPVRVVELEFPTPENQEYRWRAIATLTERKLGDRGKVYFPSEDDWKTTNSNQISLIDFLPSPEQLALENNLFLVTISTRNIDWSVVKRIQVRLEYGKEIKTFRLDQDDDTETLFLTPIIPELSSYFWQATFDFHDRTEVLYPRNESFEKSNFSFIELQNYL